MGLDPTTGTTSSEQKKKKKKPSTPSVGYPSQAAAAAVASNTSGSSSSHSKKKRRRTKKRTRYEDVVAARARAQAQAYASGQGAGIERQRAEAARYIAALRARLANASQQSGQELHPADYAPNTSEQNDDALSDVIANRALLSLRPDVQESAAYAPGPAQSGRAALDFALGPNIAAHINPPGFAPSTTDPTTGGTLLDLAMLGLPYFKGARGFAAGAKAIKEGETVAEAGRAARSAYRSRTLQVGEKAQQVPKSRSRITRNVIEKPADAVSRALDREAVQRVPGLRNATASRRAVKAAGREQLQESARDAAALGTHIDTLKGRRPAGVQEAHWWWAQMPAAVRSAKGLKLVRAKLVEQLTDIRSGKLLDDLEKQEGKLRAAMRAARAEGDTRRTFELVDELNNVQLLKADLPQQAEDIAASITRLDKIIKNPPKLEPKLIDSLRALSDDRKATLVAANVLDPERAATREGLVSRWLGLEPTGEEVYLGHRMGKVRGSNPSLLPASVGTGRVRVPEGVSRENKLVLAKTGRVDTSFKSALGDWQAAKVYRTNLRIRDDLSQMGDPLRGTRVPKDHILINPKGRVVPKGFKLPEETRAGGFDEEEVVRSARELVDEFFAQDPQSVQRMLDAAKETGVWPELRTMRKDLVERYFAQFLPAPKAGPVMSLYDSFVDMTAASIIFARIGYIPKNVVQNLVMAVPHQGAFLLPNAVRAGQILRDPELRHLVLAEVGSSGATRAIGQEATTKKVIGKLVGFVGGAADDPLRVSAWVHEASAAGIIPRGKPILTAADRQRVIAAFRNKRNRPLLNDVRSRSTDAMGDFTRMTPAQRRSARRLLIIPGWLMAGTRYPFHFAANHPIRSALLAYVAMGEPGAPERLQLNSPITDYFEGESFLRGIPTPWGRERTGSLSPVSTPWEIGRAGVQTIRGKENPFDPRQDTVFDYANPFASAAIGFTRGEGVGSLERLAPNFGLYQDLANPEASTYYPEDRTRLGRLKREIGILPIEVNDFEDEKPTASLKSELSSLRAEYRKQYGAPLPQSAADALTRKWKVRHIEDGLLDELPKDADHRRLTEAQKVAVRMMVASQSVPSYKKYAGDWTAAYQQALGDPLDQPQGADDQPNGRMHTLRLFLEGRVLGYSYLGTVTQALQDRREYEAANG